MRRPLAAVSTALLAAGLLFMGSAAASADTGTTGGGSITIPGSGTEGPGEPFPSAGTMTGVPGTITSVSLTLTELTHTFPGDLQVVIQSPSGTSVLATGFCGSGADLVGTTLTFVDGAPALSGSPIASGTYAPTLCDSEAPGGYPLPSPAPQLPYEAAFASMNGEDPNGEWKLWVFDSFGGDIGTLVSWTLAVTTEVAVVPAAAAPSLPNMGVEVTTVSLGAVALLAAGGILLYTRRRYSA